MIILMVGWVMKFIGRAAELKILERHYDSQQGELFILYGRRRVGKTELLNHFCQGKPHIYFTASQTEDADNLNQFLEICRSFLKNSFMEGMTFKSIEPVLQLLASTYSLGEKFIIVLDEFQYWVNGDLAIPSLIQRFWDQFGRHSNLMLVLCGSYISLMIDYTLAEKSPLYGRRTGQLQIYPFDYRSASLFFPGWNHRDKLLAYGVLGGIPAYLKQFDSRLSFKENLVNKFLSKGTFLSEEANFLLRTELRDPRTYSSILRAIAAGNTTTKDLCSKLSLEARALSPYLKNLQELHEIQRDVSLNERAPEKSRKGRYRIQDNYLNFWFRFVDPYITLLELDEGEELFHQKITPQLSTYMGAIFEVVCQQYLLLYGSEIHLPFPKRVGKIWESQFDIDAVSENLDDTYCFGECKWSQIGNPNELFYKLKERAIKTGLYNDDSKLLLFSSEDIFPTPKHKDPSMVKVTAQNLFANSL